MIVLGIDPGLANLGLGVVEGNSRRAKHLHHSCIITTSSQTMPERLQCLYLAIQQLIAEHQPQVVAIEEQRLKKAGEVTFKVGQAYGVVQLACAQAGLAVYSYGPTQVKKALVGTGRADKEQVIYMVRASLGMRTIGDSAQDANNHAADALALALTHLAHLPLQQSLDRQLGPRLGKTE